MAKTSLTRVTALLFLFCPFMAQASGGSYDEAPPSLSYYLSRLPAKSMGSIYAETRDPAAVPLAQPPVIIGDIILKFGTENPQKLLPLIDSWIAYTRQNYGGPEISNFLHDMRDLAQAQSKPDPLFVQYLDWRWKHGDWFKTGDVYASDLKKSTDQRQVELDKLLASAPPSLQPHWIYLKGAVYFKSGNDTLSEKAFDRVLKEFPQSPRAEAALFMKARCKYSQGELHDYQLKDIQKLQAQNLAISETLFLEYLQKYPKGRFATDTLGWIGGINYRQGKYAECLPFYVKQTHDAEHPEVFASAVTMCEKALSHLSDGIETTHLNIVAEDPRLAMGLIYLIVNSPQPGTYSNDYTDEAETARLKKWRLKVLPLLAQAVTAAKKHYESANWQPAYLLILAHAASDAGNQKQALELLDLAGKKGDSSDDLLLLRAIVEQRAGQAGQAVSTLRAFIQKFPKSPLLAGTRFRLALALQDSGQAGLALVELAAMRGNALPFGELPTVIPDVQNTIEPNPEEVDKARELNVSSLNIDYSGASDEEVDQLMDSLLNFAPMEQLEAALQKKDLDANVRRGIQDTLLERALAREDFTTVQRMAPPEGWTSRFQAMAAQTKAVSSGTPAEQAQKMAALGDLWAKARFTLLSHPLDDQITRSALYRDDYAYGQWKRMENAKALGIKHAETELDRRDELQHAFAWWIKAADKDPKNPLAPEWILNAQSALKKIADLSPYSFLRAEKIGMPARSRELYQRLLRDYPRSEKVRTMAVYWSLPERNADESDRDYVDRARLTDPDREYEKLALFQAGEEKIQGIDWKEILQDILDLPSATAGQSNADFLQSIKALSLRASSRQATRSELFMLNFLEDMELAAQQPDLSPETRKAYLALRLQVLRASCWSFDYQEMFTPKVGIDDDQLMAQIEKARQQPSMKPLQDFLEFLNTAVIANHQIEKPVKDIDKDGEPLTYSTRDWATVKKNMEEFLKKYPKSPKREAAFLLQGRARTLAARGKNYAVWQSWPATTRWEGGDVKSTVLLWPEIKAPSADFFGLYFQEFPKGKYQATLQSFAAEAAIRRSDWNKALDLISELIANSNTPSLQSESWIALTSVFDHLASDKDRFDLMAALRKHPELQNHLAIYLTSNGNPLFYLQDYLRSELKLKLPAPEAEKSA